MKSRNRDEEEENQRLMSEEYVDPSAAGELLRKFPDSSAFDFDYSQSGIWSPLIRRPFSPIDLDPATPTPRSKLCYGRNKNLGSASSGSSSNLSRRRRKKKLNCCGNVGFGFFALNLFNLKRKHPISDFSPIPPSARAHRNSNKGKIVVHGCGKVLKAAAKHFKKKSKKKDPSGHVKLSTYFMMDPN